MGYTYICCKWAFPEEENGASHLLQALEGLVLRCFRAHICVEWVLEILREYHSSCNVHMVLYPSGNAHMMLYPSGNAHMVLYPSGNASTVPVLAGKCCLYTGMVTHLY